MSSEAIVVCDPTKVLDLILGKNPPPRSVVCVLENKKAAYGEMRIGRPYGGSNCFRRGKPAVPCQGENLDPGHDCGPTRLVKEDVRGRVENNLVSPLGMGRHRNFVGHGPAWNKESRLLFEEFGRALFQANDRGIVTEDVVPYFR
jgi:hypothetical protein